MSVAGVHLGLEALVLGDAGEEVDELAPFSIGERSGQVGLVRLGERADTRQQLGAGGREVQGVDASITRVAATLDESALLEVVDQHNRLAGDHAELAGQVPLAASRVQVDQAQQPSQGG